MTRLRRSPYSKQLPKAFFQGIRLKFFHQPLPSLRVMALLAILLGSSVVVGVSLGFRLPPPVHLQRFSNYAHLNSFVNTHHPQTMYRYELGWNFFTSINTFGAEASPPSGTAGYSTTNVQVQGVDEPDFVKTDGTYIYTLANTDIVIIRAFPPEEAEIVSQIQPQGMPLSIFLFNSSRLIVITKNDVTDSYWRLQRSVAIEVYDITDPANPFLNQRIILEGEYVGARLINNYLYLIANMWIYDENGSIVLPTIIVSQEQQVIPAEQIYFDPGTVDYSFLYTTILSLEVVDPEAEPKSETFLGGASSCTLYVSLENLYIAVSRYSLWTWADTKTAIHRFEVSTGNVVYSASGQVPGFLINQFALDESAGYLRVATTSRTQMLADITDLSSLLWIQVNNVYVLDMQLNVIGRLEGLAPGETIYSVRFLGNTGYLVTFYKVDPLFVIDLTNPAFPELLGELEITGYSDYLHPLGNQQLLGIGKDVTIDSTRDIWWYQGIKLSIFNTTDPCQPEENTRLILGVRGTDSAALQDHKAVLIDTSRNLLVIPLLLAEHVDNSTNRPPWEPGDYIWQGASVFTLDAINSTITLRGGVSHIVNATALKENHWTYRDYFINRALYIGDILYALSNYKLTLHDFETLNTLAEIILNPGLDLGP